MEIKQNIDWEKRRYEIAKQLFAKFTYLYFTNKHYCVMVDESAIDATINDGRNMSDINWSDEVSDSIAQDAVINADALIKALKNIKQ